MLLNLSKLKLSHVIILGAIANVPSRIEHSDENQWIEQEEGALRELPIYKVRMVYQIHVCMNFA